MYSVDQDIRNKLTYFNFTLNNSHDFQVNDLSNETIFNYLLQYNK